MDKYNSKNFIITAIKQLLVTSILLFVQIVVFVIFSGCLIDSRSWFYFVTAFGNYVISTAIQFKLNPELLVQRLKLKREGSKLWDEILMRLSNLMIILMIPLIAGLDFRFGWSFLDLYFVWIGLLFVIASSVLLNWAMLINPHFEPTVRIQKERNHMVIRKGPYAIVRHPGYLAGILFAFSTPLLIGSFFTFVAVGIYVILIILRTWMEDKTLQEELNGYSEYVSQVKNRLFPKLW
jgi:protein-S-isoprenylcysteine O-methyltransferase Ste14